MRPGFRTRRLPIRRRRTAAPREDRAPEPATRRGPSLPPSSRRAGGGGPRGGVTGPSGGTCAAAGSRQPRGRERGAEATRPGAASGGRAPERHPCAGSRPPSTHRSTRGATVPTAPKVRPCSGWPSMNRAQMWPRLPDYVFLRIAQASPAVDWRSCRGQEPAAGMSRPGGLFPNRSRRGNKPQKIGCLLQPV